MVRPRLRAGVVAWLSVAAVLAIFACNNGTQVDRPCTNIPAGGCPLADGLSCADPACAAVYLCRPGNVWELQTNCPARAPRDPAPMSDASDDAAETQPPIADASIDAPPGAYGGPGCVDLQLGDCSLGLALSCPGTCCGCEDLYVCTAGAWRYWGYCGAGGPVYSP